MPYTIAWEPKGVCWEYSGNVTGDEIVEASTSIYGDPRFDDLRYKLVNFIGADAIDMNEKQVDIVSSQHKAAAISNPHIKTAIVSKTVTENIKKFVFNLNDSPWPVKVFDDIEEANKWLGRKA